MDEKPFNFNQIKRIVKRTAQKENTVQTMNQLTFGILHPNELEKQQENEGPTL